MHPSVAEKTRKIPYLLKVHLIFPQYDANERKKTASLTNQFCLPDNKT